MIHFKEDDNALDRKTTQLLCRAAHFLYKHLRINRDLDIIFDILGCELIGGVSYQDSVYYNINQSIYINTESDFTYETYDLVEVLSHEFVHIQQIDHGRMRQHKTTNTKDGTETWWMYWNGQNLGKMADLHDFTYEQYQSLPWEKEAFKRQRELTLAVLENIK